MTDGNVSEAAAATATKVDDIAEKIFAALGPIAEGENPLDVIGALAFVQQRLQHEVDLAVDAAAVSAANG